MRYAVLGASGAMAQATLRDLLESEPDAEIVALDRRPPAHREPRVHAAEVDVKDVAATARALEGCDAALNCVNYDFNLDVMRAALAARVPYADLGGLYHMSRRQFELDAKFSRAGVAAVLGCGSTPGITNAMAGRLARGLDAVEQVHVRVGCFDGAADGPLAVPYALDTLLDELALPPMVFRDGRAQALAPMSEREAIAFPPPVGDMTAFATLHSEVAMFPRSFPGLREASFKVAFPPALVERLVVLVELGFTSRAPLLDGVSPRALLAALVARQVAGGEPEDADALRVELVGRRGPLRVRRRAESVVRPHSRWRIAAGTLDTGIPLAVVGRLLAHRRIGAAGVLCPETCLEFDAFFAELARREIPVEWRAEEIC
jgi:saccharopine dehydrogenase-like NADP-dependent oxidoreductase